MRIAAIDGRLHLVTGSAAFDVERSSGGRFSSDPQQIYARWHEFRSWADTVHDLEPATEWPCAVARLGPPIPRPRQVFAIGLNYAAHAAETGASRPEYPPVFTKFPNCITGPDADIDLPGRAVDWEIELVLVIGRAAFQVQHNAWDYIAGLTVGQDLSERDMQMRPPLPQFSLAKSFPQFAPLGPVVVTPDEMADPGDLQLTCRLNGTVVQDARTTQMIFGVPELICALSQVVQLDPGDIIFTGTPAGVGMGRVPPVYLRPGDVLESEIESLGTITQRFR